MPVVTGGNLGTDQVLLYDVDPWNEMGFGVPNFGENVSTLNTALHGLTDEIAKMQLLIMTHIDVTRTDPPSRNTVERLGKMCNRAATIFAGRKKEDNELRLEPGHVTPAPMEWSIHPVPFFPNDFTRNKWLKEYNTLMMFFLSNAYQHTDNNLAFTITHKLAADLYQYVKEIKINMGTELLGLTREELTVDTFLFTPEHYDAYNPSLVVANFERLDTPGPFYAKPTEDALRPLFNGYPANIIVTKLKKYPVGKVPGLIGGAGLPLEPDSAAVGTTPESMPGGSASAGGFGSGAGGGGGPAIGSPVV